jgi:hypothetical protein
MVAQLNSEGTAQLYLVIDVITPKSEKEWARDKMSLGQSDRATVTRQLSE